MNNEEHSLEMAPKLLMDLYILKNIVLYLQIPVSLGG